MLNKYIYEEKNYDKALQCALLDLNTDINNLIIEEHEEEAKLFKSKKVKLIIIKKEDIKEYIINYLLELTNLMNLKVTVKIKNIDNIYNINMDSDNNAILIGKDGRTLNAIQEITRATIKKEINENIRINIDIVKYKENKNKNFEFEIKKIMQEVKKSKVEVKLDPMNSYNRRLIHNLSNEFENIKTKSIGDGLERHIVIYYKED